MLVTLVTVGGGRPEAFALCEKYMARQTYKGDIQWIVVDDDVRNPIKLTMGQELVHGPLQWREGINTQRYNLAASLPHIKGDYVFLIENDDYYREEHIETHLDFLKHAFLVGESGCTYYSLKERSFMEMNNFHHASLCSTSFRKGVIPYFERAVHSGQIYMDLAVWIGKNDCLKMLFTGMNLCVGMKGMPGRDGIGVGHRPANFEPDPDLIKLKTLLKKDWELYLPYVK